MLVPCIIRICGNTFRLFCKPLPETLCVVSCFVHDQRSSHMATLPCPEFWGQLGVCVGIGFSLHSYWIMCSAFAGLLQSFVPHCGQNRLTVEQSFIISVWAMDAQLENAKIFFSPLSVKVTTLMPVSFQLISKRLVFFGVWKHLFLKWIKIVRDWPKDVKTSCSEKWEAAVICCLKSDTHGRGMRPQRPRDCALRAGVVVISSFI